MIAFFHSESSHLIIVPHKCGTRVMTNNSADLVMNVIHPDFEYSDLQIKNLCSSANKKTFICRDPLIRYFSFFKSFSNTKNPIIPKKLTKNVFKDVANSIPLLKKHYADDVHTVMQHKFFTDFKQKEDDYEFVDTLDLNKWLYLNFALKINDYMPVETSFPSTLSDFSNFMYSVEEIKKLYEKDYLLCKRTQPL